MDQKEQMKETKESDRLPVGLERVLLVAAADQSFRQALLESDDRRAVVDVRGLPLRESELAVLCGIPRAQLQAAIDRIDLSPENVERRRFMRTVVATTAATVVAAEALGGCGMPASTGIQPSDWRDDAPRDAGPDAEPDSASPDSGPGIEMGGTFGLRPGG
jgi:hypothetical protein